MIGTVVSPGSHLTLSIRLQGARMTSIRTASAGDFRHYLTGYTDGVGLQKTSFQLEDAVAALREPDIVGYKHRSQAVVAVQLVEKVGDAVARLVVKIAGRL